MTAAVLIMCVCKPVMAQGVNPDEDLPEILVTGDAVQQPLPGDRLELDAPPMIIHDPGSTEAYSVINRRAQGVPSMAVAPGVRIWAAWYAGTTPNTIIERCPNAYVVVATSGDGGETWKEVLAIDPDGRQTEDGRIHIIWDYHRPRLQRIFMTSFTEADIMPGGDLACLDLEHTDPDT